MERRLESVPLIGVAVNASLALVKIMAGVFGNSYALIADGIESTADIVTSLVVWGGLRVSTAPATERHPYGYGKAEALAGVIASLSLLLAASLIAYHSIREIMTPHHLPHWSTLVVLLVVIVVKEWLARWIGKVGESVDSSALVADSWHHRSDALTSAAAFLGISIALVGGKGWEAADDWGALVACSVIAATGVRLLIATTRDLLDVAPPKSFEQDVRDVAAKVPGVIRVEKCRIRKSGLIYFVDIHIEVDGRLSVREGHVISGRVRGALRNSDLKIADALVHVEPFDEEANSV